MDFFVYACDTLAHGKPQRPVPVLGALSDASVTLSPLVSSSCRHFLVHILLLDISLSPLQLPGRSGWGPLLAPGSPSAPQDLSWYPFPCGAVCTGTAPTEFWISPLRRTSAHVRKPCACPRQGAGPKDEPRNSPLSTQHRQRTQQTS